MRFVKLVVEAFQAIRRAELEFGPGLNVLYGQNDLGKSTLASAVRAALLVLPSSSEATGYVSWYADAPPRVKLTFCDDDNHFWEVSKVFSQGPSAELRHSKDGVQFTLDCKARAVEEKLRGLLRWGIPSPGGKGAPRGLPVSFLANTLLASQTDVDGILKSSLEADGDASGKLRLQHALATLAQDPLFKRVLDAAQRECDTYFTETGRRRRTQGSKLMAADDEVKRCRREADALKAQLEESTGIEEHVRACRATREECVGRVSDAEAALAQARTGLANTQGRAAAEQQLSAARMVLAEMDAGAAQLRALTGEIDALTQGVASLDIKVLQAQSDLDEANVQLRSAEQEGQRALQEQGEQGRQLRRAELERELARLRERRTQLESQRELVGRAIEATRGLARMNEALVSAQGRKERTGGELKSARDALQSADAELDLSRSVLAFTRWKMLAQQQVEAEATRRSAAEQRAQADAKAAEGSEMRSRAELELAAIVERKAKLPTAEQLELIERSERALERAEAALGGGLSLVVQARKPVSLGTRVDQQLQREISLTGEYTLEAERSARLSIDGLIEIEVTAGGAEQRRAVAAARAKWDAECTPILARSAMLSVNALKVACAAANREETVARELLRSAEKLHTEAQTLRDRVDFLDQQVERSTPNASELAARRAAIGSMSLDALEERCSKLGKITETRAESDYERHVELRRTAAEQVTRLEQDAAISEHDVKGAEQQAQQASQHAQAERQAIANADPLALSDGVERELKQTDAQRASAESAIVALDTEHSDSQRRAEEAVEKARAVVEAKKGARAAAQRLADSERASLNQKQGELSAREQQAARLDRAAAARQVESCESAWAAVPGSPLATDVEVEAATETLEQAGRELSEADKEFFTAEGALSKVGGVQLREQLQQAEDGLKVAQAREYEIETDARAWKLLRETLKLAEDSEAAHLGRALSEPVSRRFTELTSERYANLEFDPALSATGLQATGVAAENGVLSALSVGTRDQLATLVRLTIANQIKSAIILDDHLVQTDPTRLAWFRDVLLKTALETQVVVFTCRPADYLRPDELPETATSCDFAGGTIRAVNLNSVVQRWEGPRSTR